MFPPRRPCPAGGPRLAFCSVVRDERVGAAPGRLVAVGISGSPSATSKSRVLVEHALAQLEARDAAVRLIDVATLPADALLGRGSASQLTDALASVAEARIGVAGTPVDRATYSGLRMVSFVLLTQAEMVGLLGVPIVTGHGVAHSLAL